MGAAALTAASLKICLIFNAFYSKASIEKLKQTKKEFKNNVLALFFFSQLQIEFKTKTPSKPKSTEMVFEYPADVSLGWQNPHPRERTRRVGT